MQHGMKSSFWNFDHLKFEFVAIIVRETCYNSNDYGMKIINFMYKINSYKPEWSNKWLILQILRNSRFTRYL